MRARSIVSVVLRVTLVAALCSPAAASGPLNNEESSSFSRSGPIEPSSWNDIQTTITLTSAEWFRLPLVLIVGEPYDDSQAYFALYENGRIIKYLPPSRSADTYVSTELNPAERIKLMEEMGLSAFGELPGRESLSHPDENEILCRPPKTSIYLRQGRELKLMEVYGLEKTNKGRKPSNHYELAVHIAATARRFKSSGFRPWFPENVRVSFHSPDPPGTLRIPWPRGIPIKPAGVFRPGEYLIPSSSLQDVEQLTRSAKAEGKLISLGKEEGAINWYAPLPGEDELKVMGYRLPFPDFPTPPAAPSAVPADPAYP